MQSLKWHHKQASANSDEVVTMKPMIWHPEEKDEKVNRYLDKINHAPYEVIAAFAIGVFCLFTLLILVGSF